MKKPEQRLIEAHVNMVHSRENLFDAIDDVKKSINEFSAALENLEYASAGLLSNKCGISRDSVIWISRELDMDIMSLDAFYNENSRFPTKIEARLYCAPAR